MKRFGLLLGSVALLLGGTGCAYRPHQLPAEELAGCPNLVRHQDLRLAATTFDPATAKSVLNEPVSDKGFVPVLLIIRNEGGERAVIDGARVRLEDGRGSAIARTGAGDVAKRCEKSVALHVILFGWLSGLGASQYNRDMTEDWKSKDLPDYAVVEPHMSLNKLVFYSVKENCAVQGGRIIVPVAVRNSPNYEEVACVLP